MAGCFAAEVGDLLDPDGGIDQVGARVELLVADGLDGREGCVCQLGRRVGVRAEGGPRGGRWTEQVEGVVVAGDVAGEGKQAFHGSGRFGHVEQEVVGHGKEGLSGVGGATGAGEALRSGTRRVVQGWARPGAAAAGAGTGRVGSGAGGAPAALKAGASWCSSLDRCWASA